jgi:predicted O-methyltransferase YrrM
LTAFETLTNPAMPLTALEAYTHHTKPQNWSDMIDHLSLLRQASRGNVLEIGVRGGISTSALLLGVQEKGGHLWSVDINPCGNTFAGHPGWTFIQADSIKEKDKIISAIPDSLDVLFVDGDHSYEGAKSDLETFGPSAKTIFIHDVECPSTYPDVRKAFDEFVGQWAKGHLIMSGSYGMGVINMCNIGRASKIAGWMTPKELVWLARQAETHSSIIEVGSYQGQTTRVLGDNTQGRVYAVDDWKGLRENWWIADTPQEVRDTLFLRFTENCNDLINSGVIIPLAVDHADVKNLANAPNAQLIPRGDMIFIDGDHRYESVKRDIESWLPQLESGGLLCGHDFNQGGVHDAVMNLLPEAKTAAGLIWEWVKP